MTKIEGNTLIAFFIGATEMSSSTDSNGIKTINSFQIDDIYCRNYEADRILKYHSSWNWLMPVVEKIMNYDYPDYHREDAPEHPFEDCAYLRTFGMRDENGNYMVRFNASRLFITTTLIEATYMAVIDFIEWYNSTLTNKTIK